MDEYKTVVMFRELSADEKLRREAYYREKRLHDEATALGHARREGITIGKAEGIVEGVAKSKAEITAKMRKQGYSEEQIKKLFDE